MPAPPLHPSPVLFPSLLPRPRACYTPVLFPSLLPQACYALPAQEHTRDRHPSPATSLSHLTLASHTRISHSRISHSRISHSHRTPSAPASTTSRRRATRARGGLFTGSHRTTAGSTPTSQPSGCVSASCTARGAAPPQSASQERTHGSMSYSAAGAPKRRGCGWV